MHARTPGSGRPSKVTEEIKAVVDAQMLEDDETTAYQLHFLLVSRGYRLSLRTVLRCPTIADFAYSTVTMVMT